MAVINHSTRLRSHYKKPIELLYRDPVEVVQELLRLPLNESNIIFAPCKVFQDEERTNRRYSDMYTGKFWWEEQVRPYPTNYLSCLQV
jgi:hypothetical protein